MPGSSHPSSPSVLITGTSTGIGYSLSKIFIENGYQVFGSVRKEADAGRLKSDFPERFFPLLFDVTDVKGIEAAAKIVGEKLRGKGLGGLVNNAGIAQGGPLLYMDMDLVKKHFEVNVFGAINVIKAFAPLLGAVENYPHLPGKIINISSSSGKIASPFVAPYVGSKFALEGISGSLRRELMKFGIDVIVIGPGVVKTPIWDKARNLEQYDNTPYKIPLKRFKEIVLARIDKGLEPEEIARKTFDVFHTKNPKTRYAISPNRLTNWILPRLIPERTLDKIFAKIQYLNKNAGSGN